MKLLLLLLALSRPAAAADFAVESAGLMSQVDAEAAATRLRDSGLSVRVYRRLQPGEGVGHVVEVGGLTELDAARAVARTFAVQGLGAAVYEGKGSERKLVVSAPATTRPVKRPPPAEEPGAREGRTAKVLKTLGKNHSSTWEELKQAEGAVLFEFEREVELDQGTLRVRHRYLRQGLARRLEVEVLEGEGQDSLTVITSGNQAWLRVGEETSLREADRARVLVDRFSPEAVWSVPLTLSERILSAPAWAELQPVRGAKTPMVLRREAEDGLQEVVVDLDASVVSAVSWREGDGIDRWTLSSYEELAPGLLLPRHLEVWADDARVETLDLLILEAGVLAPEGTFSKLD